MFLLIRSANATVWHVGQGHVYTTPKALATAHQLLEATEKRYLLKDGDIIEIEAGVYKEQEMLWGSYRQGINNLTIRGIGGMAHLIGPSNGLIHDKGIFIITGKNTHIENIEFSGAYNQSSYNIFEYGNGAGIRTEPGIEKLTLKNCYFHHNENGILTPNDPEAELLIKFSEFSHNGAGDGYSHNIYVGHYKKFTLQYSSSHRAKVGHNIKSRAEQNFIMFNRIADEEEGRSSYAIDLPNGGEANIIGNIIHQGKNTENSKIIFAYGLLKIKKGLAALHPLRRVTVAHNIFINDKGIPDFIHLQGHPMTNIVNNVFKGRGKSITIGD